MSDQDALRSALAKAAYERDAHSRWGAAYFTPWEMLNQAVQVHYWDAQQWIVDIVEQWAPSSSDQYDGRETREDPK